MPLRISKDATPTRPHVDAEDGLVRGDYAILKLALEHAEAECARLNEELAVTDTLLEDRRAVLALIPECPTHGQHCLPHQRDFIETAASAESEIARLRGLIAALPCRLTNGRRGATGRLCADVWPTERAYWCPGCIAKAEAASG